MPTLEYMELLASDIGVIPSLRKLTRKYLSRKYWWSRDPTRGALIVNYYYQGMITAAPYRLFGHGSKPDLAEATILRMARDGKALSEEEVILLSADRALWRTDVL